MVKVEPEKNLFGGSDTPQHYLDRCQGLDVATGERTIETWKSMPHFQVLTESVLGSAIGLLLNISCDTPSGVLVLSPEGRWLFLETTTQNDWTYLIRAPFEGGPYEFLRGLKIGSLPVTFKYHPEVVDEENGSSSFDEKRRKQLELMYGYALTQATQVGLKIPDAVTAMVNRLKLALPGVRSAIG
jgi:hypothetical protein